jgi:hypothetical protein
MKCYGLLIILKFQKYERFYHEQLLKGEVTQKAQFEYSWCLVRSKYPADIRKGITLLEDLFSNGTEDGKRDYLYYLAIGNARIKVSIFVYENVHSLSNFVNFSYSINITVNVV